MWIGEDLFVRFVPSQVEKDRQWQDPHHLGAEFMWSPTKDLVYIVVPAKWVNSSSSWIVVSHTISSYRESSQLSFTLLNTSNYIPQNSTSKAHTWYLLFATRAHCSPFSGIPSILCNLSFLLPFFLFFLLKTKTQ